jgi:hypothetical protein
MNKAAAILEWATVKMDERYELLMEAGCRDIASYNDNRLVGSAATGARPAFQADGVLYRRIAALAKLRATTPALREGVQVTRVAEGKPGATMRSGAPYSTWNNGMERSITYFHNAIGLLTEITGHPTPSRIALVPDNQLPRNDLPAPIAPQTWRFRQSIDYSLSINRAVLDYASRNRDRLLFNIWRMGANAIARGETDTWRVTPSRIDALKAAAGQTGRTADPALYDKVLRDPALRDPRVAEAVRGGMRLDDARRQFKYHQLQTREQA